MKLPANDTEVNVITLGKLTDVLSRLDDGGVKLRGASIYATGGGELALSFKSQLSFDLGFYLQTKGFVCVNGDYIYRP